ncbi:DUF397 domain-containing protein [Saccharopolyspora shandongensis]|uniref:DUF397 domain-containing protein n=1 Tax=Saccharopolyspora shandongensis TaxID=418495 RepID=UPI0033E857EB
MDRESALPALTRTTWRKSTRSTENACIEVASATDVVGVRDSKLGVASPVLAFDGSSFGAFIDAIKARRFD